MRLQESQKFLWQGKPFWNPSAWTWVHTFGRTGHPDRIEKARLATARPFTDKDGTAAIELSVALERTRFSTLLRLDDSAGIPRLSKQLNALRGFTLKEIGEMEIPVRDS
jgi:hypothetical protein